jgi:hypothetical protein
MRKILKFFLPLLVIITCLSFLIYGSIQQVLRQGANDPQIQIAEDIAYQASRGDNPLFYLPPGKVDIARSLATFVLIYDSNAKLLSSTAILDNKNPVVPQGVFENVKNKGETRFTWQPKEGVRNAVVAVYYKGEKPGYILVGRSLREVEQRVERLTFMVFAGWLFTTIALFLSVYLLSRKS